MTNAKSWARTLFGLLVMAALQPDLAYAGTQAEYQALRQWCEKRATWTAKGRETAFASPKQYNHFQHYCSAMVAMQKVYRSADRQKRRYAAGVVIDETDYVISHVAEDHVLMPEVYALRGQALAADPRNAVKAETNLLKALQLDPMHTAVYTTLARLYLNTDRKAKAVETVKAGLAIDPQRRSLRRLAEELGIAVESARQNDAPPKLDPAEAGASGAGRPRVPTQDEAIAVPPGSGRDVGKSGTSDSSEASSQPVVKPPPAQAK